MFPKEVREKASKIGGDFIKAAEFEGEGLTLQVAKPMEKIASQYGAEEGDFLVNNEILEVGQTFRYSFNTADGQERKLDSNSTPLFIGFKQCEDLGVGDWVKITRTGKTDKTRYAVEKVDAPSGAKPVAKRNSAEDYEPNPDDVPF